MLVVEVVDFCGLDMHLQELLPNQLARRWENHNLPGTHTLVATDYKVARSMLLAS